MYTMNWLLHRKIMIPIIRYFLKALFSLYLNATAGVAVPDIAGTEHLGSHSYIFPLVK